MNKRIKELAEQAGIIPGIMGLNRFTHFDPEKFAELIVRECATIARGWSDDYVVEDTAPRQIDAMIKKHFGVEE